MVARRGSLMRFGRLFRVKGERETVVLLDARNNEVAKCPDATYDQVAKNTTTAVMDIGEDGRQWMLPAIQVNLRSDTDMKGFRVQQFNGTKWEVMSSSLVSAGHTWACVCKKMKIN